MLDSHCLQDRPGVLDRVKGTLAARGGFAALDPASALQVLDIAGNGQTAPPAGGFCDSG